MDEENKCPVCGEPKEREWHILCRNCFDKMHNGEIVGVKREDTGLWKVHTREGWVNLEKGDRLEPDHIYSKKSRLITKNELRFLPVIQETLSKLSERYKGTSYNVFPQVALSSLICKEDSVKWRTELFRSVDFLITNQDYEPLLVIEINDRSHYDPERIQRDIDLRVICEEAGIPIVFLDGRKEAPEISSEELHKKLKDVISDISESDSPTYLYSVRRPEICSHLSLDRTLSEETAKTERLPKEGTRTGSVSNRKSKKTSGNAGCIISILALVAIILGIIYMVSLFREKEQNIQQNESKIEAIDWPPDNPVDEMPDNLVDASCFSNSSPMLSSLYDKSLAYSQESEQSSIKSGLEVPVRSTIKAAYFMKAVDTDWPHIHFGKNIKVSNAIVVISHYKIQYLHDPNLIRETWLVWVYPNFMFDNAGNLSYDTEHEYHEFLTSRNIEELEKWMYEEYCEMEITELDISECVS